MDAAGDDEALGRLYEEYMPKLMDWLQKRQEVRSPSRQYAYLAANIASDLAAEIASHVWEQVLGDLRRGKQLDDFGAYLIGVAKIRLRRLACGPRRRVDDVTVREEAEALERHAAAGPRPEEVAEARCMHLMYQHLYGMLLGYEAAPNQTLCFAFVQLLGTRPRSLVEGRRGSELDALADAFLEEMVAAGCPLPEAAVPTLRDRLSLPIERCNSPPDRSGYTSTAWRRSGATYSTSGLDRPTAAMASVTGCGRLWSRCRRSAAERCMPDSVGVVSIPALRPSGLDAEPRPRQSATLTSVCARMRSVGGVIAS